MLVVNKKITVDLSRRSNVRLIFARQNDTGSRKLLVTLTDGGEIYIPESGSAASFNFKRADGVCGAIAANLTNKGEVSVELPQIVLGAIGETVCSVSIFDPNKNKLTSSDFCLDVTEDYYSGESVDTNPDYSLLQSIFAEIAGYSEEERKRATAESARASNERMRIMAEVEREQKLYENLGVNGTISVLASNWRDDNSQKVAVPLLGEYDLVTLYPATSADRSMMANYRIYVDPNPVSGMITVSADGRPAADLSLNYFITKGRAV